MGEDAAFNTDSVLRVLKTAKLPITMSFKLPEQMLLTLRFADDVSKEISIYENNTFRSLVEMVQDMLGNVGPLTLGFQGDSRPWLFSDREQGGSWDERLNWKLNHTLTGHCGKCELQGQGQSPVGKCADRSCGGEWVPGPRVLQSESTIEVFLNGCLVKFQACPELSDEQACQELSDEKFLRKMLRKAHA